MNTQAVISLIVGTVLVLAVPALILSMDMLRRHRGTGPHKR